MNHGFRSNVRIQSKKRYLVQVSHPHDHITLAERMWITVLLVKGDLLLGVAPRPTRSLGLGIPLELYNVAEGLGDVCAHPVVARWCQVQAVVPVSFALPIGEGVERDPRIKIEGVAGCLVISTSIVWSPSKHEKEMMENM